MLDYWEAFNYLYTIPVLSYYTSAFIFDIYTYKQLPLKTMIHGQEDLL